MAMTAILAWPENPMLYPYEGTRVEVFPTDYIHPLSGDEQMQIRFTIPGGRTIIENVWDSELNDWQGDA